MATTLEVRLDPRKENGFMFRRKSVTIYNIDKDHQAANLGVHENDVLVAIDGESYDGQHYKEARSALVAALAAANKAGSGRKVRLTLKRGGGVDNADELEMERLHGAPPPGNPQNRKRHDPDELEARELHGAPPRGKTSAKEHAAEQEALRLHGAPPPPPTRSAGASTAAAHAVELEALKLHGAPPPPPVSAAEDSACADSDEHAAEQEEQRLHGAPPSALATAGGDSAANGKRIADDGFAYTKEEFIGHYGGVDEWLAAEPHERSSDE